MLVFVLVFEQVNVQSGSHQIEWVLLIAAVEGSDCTRCGRRLALIVV